MCVYVYSVSLLLQPHELQPARLPCPWDFQGKNTGVSSHFLLQGIFLTQGLNPHLMHWQLDGFFTTEPPGRPLFIHIPTEKL